MKAGIRFHIRDRSHGTELAIGPGKVAPLEAMAQTGSITSAAKRLGMSYHRAWLRVDETNRCHIRPAVKTTAGVQKGGGTVLTLFGAGLVRRYRALEHQTEAGVARKLSSMLRALPLGG
jgi:molybdate transport system regulatory protein